MIIPNKPRKTDRRWKHTIDFGVQQHYRYFLRYQKFPKIIKSKPAREELKTLVPYSVFAAITKEYYAEVQRRVLSGEQIKLPFLGNISITKRKMDFSRKNKDGSPNLPFDFETYNKTGQKAYFMNEHRDYFLYKIKWRKNWRQPNIQPYVLIPERYFKRKLAKILKTDKTIDYKEYIEIG